MPPDPLVLYVHACINIHISVTPLLKILATDMRCAVDETHAHEHVDIL